jgi:DNA polymerase III sliding clamp (beta) subunit (PCNA family)
MQRLESIYNDYGNSGILRLLFKRTDKREEVCDLTFGNEEEAHYELRTTVKMDTEKEGRIAVNLKYIKDAIKYFSMASVELTAESSPMMFSGDIKGLKVVVMPMYVDWT